MKTETQNSVIKSLSHGSYMMLSAYAGMAWGCVLGAFLFVGSFLSDGIHEMLPEDLIAGLPTGLACLFFLPVFLGLMGVLLGWASYPVFSFILRATEGVKVSGVIETEQDVLLERAYAQRKRRW